LTLRDLNVKMARRRKPVQETDNGNVSSEAVAKKEWVTPTATAEQVSQVTMGNLGGAGDGFNSCHT
jgi:predicted chitinase